jgi:hypothetical protein
LKQCPEEILEKSSSGVEDAVLINISKSYELKNEKTTAKFKF